MRFLFKEKVLLFVLVMMSCVSLEAQQNGIKNRDVITLFDNNKELWIKKYQGTFDNVHPITMSIATNGDEWKGIYRFESSKTEFIIEADQNNELLDFVEIDANNHVTGHMLLKLENKNLIGEWKSENGLQTYDVMLYLLPYEMEEENRSSYVDVYSGTFQEQRAEFTIVKEKGDLAMMELTIDNDIIPIHPECANEECTIFQDTLHGRTDGLNMIRFKKLKDQISITASGERGIKVFATLTKDGSLDYKNYNYADYSNKKDILYPRTGTKFDQYFDELIDDYTNKNDDKNTPDDRSTDRFGNELLAWVDIHYYDANIISGLLFYTLDGGQQMTKSFNYDLKTDKPIIISEMFKGKNTLKNKSEDYVKEAKKNIIPFDSLDVQKWYLQQSFDLITLNQEGICFSTEYNTIIGTQTITLPFSELEDKMKKEYLKAFLKK